MENGLATAIRRHGERSLIHATDASHRASNSDELGALTLLHQRKRGLKEIQRSESVDSNMFFDDVGVTGSNWGEVVANASVGDDEVELGDSLGLDGDHSLGGVCVFFVVDFHDDDFAGWFL